MPEQEFLDRFKKLYLDPRGLTSTEIMQKLGVTLSKHQGHYLQQLMQNYRRRLNLPPRPKGFMKSKYQSARIRKEWDRKRKEKLKAQLPTLIEKQKLLIERHRKRLTLAIKKLETFERAEE